MSWIRAESLALALALAVLGCGASAPEAKSAASSGYYGGVGTTAEQAAPPAAEGQAYGGGADFDEPAVDSTAGAPNAEMPGRARAPAPPPLQKPPVPAKDGRSRRLEQQVPAEADKGVASVAQPLLIYAAQLTMVVVDVGKALADVEELARQVGGFLARRDDTTITIRVPAARFDDSIEKLEAMGEVVARRVTAEDVTEEFLDLEVRLKNARAVRARLEQLLAKATKVEESLLIQRELDRVAGEIERMEGRLKFLKDRIALSTITVTFRPKRTEILGAGVFRLPIPWLDDIGLRRLLTL